jgi:hypothetical protein
MNRTSGRTGSWPDGRSHPPSSGGNGRHGDDRPQANSAEANTGQPPAWFHRIPRFLDNTLGYMSYPKKLRALRYLQAIFGFWGLFLLR